MSSQSILLSTVGSSPQVVTETLYAIAEQKLSWPTEVRIITTSLGAEKVRQGLIAGKQLERLCHELSLPIPKFGDEQLLVVTNEQGQYVEDARSLADHEALANFIMHQVQQITDNENCILHASLAGGRKTMTFYLGYVMSLFGRQQDTLSHVLVSEGYEGKPNFWYPTKNPDYREIKDYSGSVIAGLDASQAQVTLANIPFIRHRHNLPKLLLKEKTKITFNQLVQLINLGENPEDIELIINLKKRTIVVADKNKQLNCQQEFKPSFIEFAFYLMLVNGTQKGDSTLYRPATERADLTLLELFLDTILSLTNIEPGQSYQESLERLKDWAELHGGVQERTLNALTNNQGINSGWFDGRKSKLVDSFNEKLPVNLAKYLSPKAIYNDEGDRVSLNDSPQKGGFGIPLPEPQTQITIIKE